MQLVAVNIELEHVMARRELHRLELANVPGVDDQAPRVGVAPDLVDDLGELVDLLAVRGTPAPPLRAINGTEFAILVGRPGAAQPLFQETRFPAAASTS